MSNRNILMHKSQWIKVPKNEDVRSNAVISSGYHYPPGFEAGALAGLNYSVMWLVHLAYHYCSA